MNLSPLPIQKFFANNGRPLVSGKLFTYTAGTTTKVATYTDSSGGTPNTNPIILNFRGECRVWIDPTLAYKFVLSPSNDTDPPTSPIWTVDNITASPMPFDNTSNDTGSVNNLSLTIPRISSPVAFTRVVFKAANTNTGATTLQINGGTARPVVDQAGNAMSGGEITQNGIYEAIYDGANWQLQWQLKYPRSAAEASAGVVPSNYRYPVGHGRRYGMLGDGVSNDTVACETWLQFCYNSEVEATIDSGNFMIGDADISISGGRLNAGMKITGSGKNVTRFKQFGSPTALMRFTGTAFPQPNSMQLMMRDIAFIGSGRTCLGIVLDGIASFHFDNVTADGFTVGCELLSSLIGSFENSTLSANNIGLRTRRNGGAYCNSIQLSDTMLTSNLQFGGDFGDANGITLSSCDIEGNGVSSPTSAVTISNASPAVVTWNSHNLSGSDPVIFTTTGSLPSPLVVNQIYYVIPATANTFRLSTVIGGADINTTTAGSGTHTAISPNTGGIVIRKTCIDELGYAYFTFADCWFETNNGASIRGEYMSSAFGLTLEIRSGHVADTGNSMPIAIGNARYVSISDFMAVVGSNTTNISCDGLYLKNSKFINLVRPSVSYTTVINCTFNGVDFQWGETGSSTLTLTGCTTSPTGTVTWLIQGRSVSINLPDILGTSNSTAATLTGLPTNLAPTVSRGVPCVMEDNGADSVRAALVATTGVITLNYIANFVAAGSKGVRISSFSYVK